MCNSVFINFLSNSLATSVNKLEAKINGSIDKIECLSHPMHDEVVKIGSVQEGQSKNIVFRVFSPEKVSLDLSFSIDGEIQNYKVEENCQVSSLDNAGFTEKIEKNNIITLTKSDFAYILPKMLMLNIIREVLTDYNVKKAQKKFEELYETIENEISISEDENLQTKLGSLLKDIKSGETNEGQLFKSVSKETWFRVWGAHYLKYFARSHQLEACSNFKDFSLQIYESEHIKKVKNYVEDVFSKIPVPKPSRGQVFQGNYKQVFYCRSGGCVDGYGITNTLQGEKMVKDLKKGDVLINSQGQFSEIVCVLKRKVEGFIEMVSINGMKITAWHPVRVDKEWEFPANLCSSPLSMNLDYVYNFVLKDNHFLTVNSVDVITLGHNFSEGCLKHPFFGSHKVIDQLKTHPGWEEGMIEYKYNPSYCEKGLVSSLW